MKDYTQRRLEEFDGKYAKAGIIGDRKFEEYLPYTFQSIKDFVTESIAQAIAEERERVKGEIEEIPDTLNVENNDSQQIYENWGRQAMKRDILSSLDKEINNQ